MSQRYDPVTGKVVPVFFHYAIPSVLGMLAVTSAGIIDGIFIGNFVGSAALAAVNISFPIWAVFAALVFMLAVGGSVMAGKFLGEGNTDAASRIFSKTLIAATTLAVFISASCLLFIDQLIMLLGANEELHGMVKSYISIILWFVPILVAALCLDYFVRVDGRPLLASAALVGFAVTNIMLNWIFIVNLGWGITGAAWASGLAEVSIFLILITHWLGAKSHLKFTPRVRGWYEVVRAAYNGFSEFANELSIGLIVLLFNWVMITRMGVAGVAAYTIIGYLVMLGLEVCYGISESLQPTVSKNLGARKPDRIVKFALTALLSAFSIGLLASALFVMAPSFLISLFLPPGEEQAAEIALEFISWFWPAFLFNGANITLSSYFTALHKPMQSAAISVSRSLVLPVAGLLLLPIWLGDIGVYIAVPIAEGLTFLMALMMALRYTPKRVIGELR